MSFSISPIVFWIVEFRSSPLAHPFARLQAGGFWHRIANPGYDAKSDYSISSMTKLCEIYAGARLDDTLFVCLMDPVARERLRDVLVQTYFAPEIQPQMAGQGFVNLAAFACSARRYELMRSTKTVYLCPKMLGILTLWSQSEVGFF